MSFSSYSTVSKNCSLCDVIICLQMVAAFTRGDVKLEVEKGGKFEFFGGNISGEFESLVSFWTKFL